jgi:hypothetical protein
VAAGLYTSSVACVIGDVSKLHGAWGKLDEGKRYPERFDRRVIGIRMGDNKVSDGSDSAESDIDWID